MSKLVELLIEKWNAECNSVRAGVPQAAIKSFERNFRVSLPGDLRLFYLAVDGMEEGSGDGALFRFLPLSEVRPIGAVFGDMRPDPADSRFAVVDYCIASHFYAVDLGTASTRGRVEAVYSLSKGIDIAPSFTDFVSLYLRDSSTLL